MEQQNDIIAEEKQISSLVEPELDVSCYFDGDKFVPERLANDIISKYIFLYKDDTLYFYENGLYKPIRDVVYYEIKKRLGDKYSTFRHKETVADIKGQSIRPIDELPINYINVRNGLFNLETMELEPHDHKYFTITQINAEYYPEAEPVFFKKFLSEIVNDDDATIIQEWFGYCLYRDYPFHKAIMLIGDGANGKSTLIDILRNFIGRENCSNVPLQQLSERFALSALHGKMINYYSDLSSRAFTKTGEFKILTGQDYLMAEKKFVQDRIQFKNYAKLTFSCNKLPEVSGDDSDAFYRRWLFINFPNKFEGENADKDILNKLDIAIERNGLFIWALEGLKRLMSQSGFSHSKTTDDLRAQYDRLSSPVKAFLMDVVEFSAEGRIPKQELYGNFIDYCRKNNIPGISKDKFFKDLSKEGNIITERPEINGKRVWCCLGIRYQENTEFNKNDPDDVDLSNYI